LRGKVKVINITIDFKDAHKFQNLIRYIEDNTVYFEAQAAMMDLADETVTYMRDVIKAEKKRPSKGDTLEQAIDKEILNTTAGIEVGIGNISKLKAEAPYYEVLDQGGYIPNHGNFVPLGSFVPGEPKPNQANFREGQWSVGTGKYTFKAKRAIEGINYIAKAIKNLEARLNEEIKKMGAKLIDGLGKM